MYEKVIIGVILAQDLEEFLLLIFPSRKLDFLLQPCYMKINSNQVISINMILWQFGKQNSEFLHQLYPITGRA